jgi:D-sedoheptulose 7-phosphate isomerase
MSIQDHLASSAQVLTRARDYDGIGRVDAAVAATVAAVRSRAPVLVCGNGGSASDAMHIAGELVGRFLKERRAINCICLVANPAVLTAWSNDYDYESVFARQVEAHGAAGGVLIGLSTSGNSANVIAAFHAARGIGMTTIALTGEGGGRLAELSDVLVDVPSCSTPMIQQVHICLYHYLCERVEAELFPPP